MMAGGKLVSQALRDGAVLRGGEVWAWFAARATNNSWEVRGGEVWKWANVSWPLPW